MATPGGAAAQTISGISQDSEFAPTLKDDGTTSIGVSDSEFTTPTTVSASSSDSANSNAVTSVTTIDASATTDLTSIRSGGYTRYGEKITDTALRGLVIGSLTCWLKKFGSPTGNAVARVRKTSDDSVVGTSNNVDVTTISTSYSNITFTFSTPVITPNEDFYVLIEYSGGDASNYLLCVFTNTSDVYANGTCNIYNGSYTNYATSDARMAITFNNYPAATKDDKTNPTTKKWQSSSEVAPWLKADMNTAQELLGVAVHFHANTTVTSIKIETSSDDSTYIRRKTVPYALATAGAWNIILFPRPPRVCRYLKITGLDAGAKVLSINEIAVLILTESVINRRHRHVDYTPTNTCTSLLGA